jgi:hypothetical protein
MLLKIKSVTEIETYSQENCVFLPQTEDYGDKNKILAGKLINLLKNAQIYCRSAKYLLNWTNFVL